MSRTRLQKAELLNSLHVPGEPLIVANVWGATTAKIVSEAPGVTALATFLPPDPDRFAIDHQRTGPTA